MWAAPHPPPQVPAHDGFIVLTTSNNIFGPTEISYLESRFYALVIQANRYDVKNGNDPTLGNITEEKEAEMEEFIDNSTPFVHNRVKIRILDPVGHGVHFWSCGVHFSGRG